MKKHILVISQYFHPEQFRINDICEEWIRRGYKVTVITGIPNYPQGKFYKGYNFFKKRKETCRGVEIIRISLIPRGKSSVMLVLNYFSFVVSGFFWKVFTRIKADCVFIFEVSPMTQALPGVWYARKRKVPCFLYVQDLWPENVEIITGISNKRIISAIGKMVDHIYAGCSWIFTTSEGFMKSIHDRGVPLEKIVYWPQYAEDFYMPMAKEKIPEIPNDGSVNIIYTGNIGYAQGLDILPKTAAILKEKNIGKKIRFVIVGDGRYKNEMIQIVESLELQEMFYFVDKQPAMRIPVFIAACDLAFLSLTDSKLFEMTIPAKLQSYMACGIPILASAAGETDKIIHASNSGFCSQPGNPELLARNIIELAGRSREGLKKLGSNGRNYYERHFDKNTLLNEMDQYFIKIDSKEQKNAVKES